MAASDNSAAQEKSTKTENVPRRVKRIAEPKMEDIQDFWIPPEPMETARQKFARKVKENPLVPVGTFTHT